MIDDMLKFIFENIIIFHVIFTVIAITFGVLVDYMLCSKKIKNPLYAVFLLFLSIFSIMWLKTTINFQPGIQQ